MKNTDDANKTVVLSIFSLQGGGAERFVLTLAQGFKALGYKPHIVCFKPTVDYEVDDVDLHFLPYQAYRWLPKTIRHRLFAKVFDNYVLRHISPKPTLILSNLWQVDQVLSHSRLANLVFVIHNTLSQERKIHDYLTDKALNEVYQQKNIVAVSQGVEDDVSKLIKNLKSITTIHNPIDRKRILSQARQSEILENLIKDHPVLQQGYIVHVGKFKTQKNHKGLLQAYAKSNQKKPLLLIGEGALQEECKALCHHLNIQDKVVFSGFFNNPYPFIASASAMVLSSFYEGFGIVIAEALSLNIPVISSDCDSGPRELLPAKNLVAVNDEDALALKLSEVMQSPNVFMSAFSPSLLPSVVAQKYLGVVS